MMDKTAILVGGPILAAKIGPAGPILAAKLVRGTSFGRFFCQNRSGQTDFRGDRFWCDISTAIHISYSYDFLVSMGYSKI